MEKLGLKAEPASNGGSGSVVLNGRRKISPVRM